MNPKVLLAARIGGVVILGLFVLNTPILGDPIRKLFNVNPATGVKIGSLPQKDTPAQSPTPNASPTPQATTSPSPVPSAPAQPVGDCKEPKKSQDAQKVKVVHYSYPETKNLVPVTGEADDVKLKPSAAKAYLAMKAKAKEAGIIVEIASGYRSIDDQYKNFEYKAAKDPSRSFADLVKFNSIAGFSEHHTGLALDIVSKEYPSLNQGHADSTVGKWLLENAKSFGFEMSFGPKNTLGVGHEPWHWRFVGDDESKKTFCFVTKNFPTINPQ
jgi:zinc D-Ala-D-Ala carboxypeptidase